jgi:hypothetical protein
VHASKSASFFLFLSEQNAASKAKETAKAKRGSVLMGNSVPGAISGKLLEALLEN